MRISDDRYSRDRQRLDIAMHFIRHEARTHTIRQWTGLTDDRIRKLYRSYLQDGGCRVARHRGKSPQQAAFFMRSARLRHEAGALAGLCCLVGVLARDQGRVGTAGSAATAALAGVGRAAALCQAYDAYRAIVASPGIGFEHAVLLVNALARGSELALGACQGCGALLVVDSLALRPARCALCAVDDPRRGPGCNSARRARPMP
ncbi:MAG: hypothetical protein KGL25_07715 [Gammaproteobacteria bacterium]|nr:hypothetical protein [Gammaproteobacteria bacterium]